jgi:hypothetical protein
VSRASRAAGRGRRERPADRVGRPARQPSNGELYRVSELSRLRGADQRHLRGVRFRMIIIDGMVITFWIPACCRAEVSGPSGTIPAITGV